MSKKKLLYIAPHLSTGGMPQYLLKQIQTFKSKFDIEVIEYNDHSGGVFVVQKNKIADIVNLHTLYDDKEDNLLKLIEYIKPDIIHFTEIPEHFISHTPLDTIFDNTDRKYKIVSSTHGSFTNPNAIKYQPDRYVLASEWSRLKFEPLGIDTIVWEYPIENINYNKIQAKQELGFERDWKHVLMVGLFSLGKNQSEIFNVARLLEKYKIKFHFVGNQAANFEDYWKPLMKYKPTNCVVWGERNDTDKFYKASDLFYFSSTLELNPLSIKEALSYKLPSIFRRLDTYLDTYDNNELVTYIDDDIYKTRNILLEKLGITANNDNSVSIILSHADTDFRKQLLKNCIHSINTPTILSSHYPVDTEVQNMTDWTIFEKENPLLYSTDFKKYNVNYSRWYLDENGNKQHENFDFEHSYAVYKLIQSGLRYAREIGKSIVHIVNYDYELSPTVLHTHERYLEEYDMIFYKYDTKLHPDYANSASTGLFSGNIDVLSEFFEKYQTLDEYYSHEEGWSFFEVQVYNYFTNLNDIRIKELEFDELTNHTKTNQEGLLQFSKDWKRNNSDKQKDKNKLNTNMIRTELIQSFIDKYDYNSYLEIGLSNGVNYENINIPFKESIDPAETEEGQQGEPTYKMTSDEFFEKYTDKTYDIIFIDGLHHSDQVDKDIENSVKALNPNGIIVLHDCNPQQEIHQRVPRETGYWHGDVWKSFVKFKHNNPLFDCFTVDTDTGCGIIRPKKSLPIKLTFDWLVNHRKEALDLISIDDFKKRL